MHLPATPQHDKFQPHQEEAQTVGQFLEWILYEKRYQLCELSSLDKFYPVSFSIQELIAEFFDIDYDAYSKEKEAVLEYVRSLNIDTSDREMD